MKKTTVVIIGGGATGSGILRDLSMRGVPALLCEMGGLCHGTSSRFHGLLHSGGRYAVSDGEAAAECIVENTILRRIGKQCVVPTEGYFVLTEEDDPAYVEKWVSGCAKAGITIHEVDPAEARRQEPALSPTIRRVFEIPDGTIDGFRLVLHNVMSARRYGGEFLSYHAVIGITSEGGKVTGVDVVDRNTGAKKHIACDVVVNASGSWSGRVAGLAGLDVPVTPDKGTLIIFNHRVASRVINRLHKSSDGDIFVPHGSVTILGTTSRTVQDPGETRPSTEEILRLLDFGRPVFPDIDSFRILRAFAGTRPLYTPGGALGRAVSRGFHISDHAEDGLDGFYTIFGGKFTTFRLMAEKLTDIVCRRLGVSEPCRTAEEPILPDPSPELLKKAARVFLPQSVPLVAERLGDDLEACVDHALAHPEPNPLICECEMVSWAEIGHVSRDPQTHSLTDIRLRTRMGMGTCQGTFCSLRTAAALAEHGLPYGRGPVEDMASFLQERWKGIRYAYWGGLAREIELTRLIYAGGLGAGPMGRGAAIAAFDTGPVRRVAPEVPAGTRSAGARDLVVVGAGLAGLVAALVAARKGENVTVLSTGSGALSIATAAIDVLGATAEGTVTGDPTDAISHLDPRHPYAILGPARVREALAFLAKLAADAGWPLTGVERAPDGGVRCENRVVPTVAGTRKVTCLVPATLDTTTLRNPKKILICGVTGLRDCTPGMALEGLRDASDFPGCAFDTVWLESPVPQHHRVTTTLDVARALESEAGLKAFCASLRAAAHGKGYDAVFLPPVLGTRPGRRVPDAAAAAAGCPVFELTGLPPGVTGLRTWHLLMDALRATGNVSFMENTTVTGCEIAGDRVTSVLTSHADGLRRYPAKRFIIATGGVISGGISVEPGRAIDSVLGLVFDLPAETADWTDQDVFAPQRFAALGVSVSATLQPLLDGRPLARNVRCAGRVIGGHDPIFERCGNGVALATGYHAAMMPWEQED